MHGILLFCTSLNSNQYCNVLLYKSGSSLTLRFLLLQLQVEMKVKPPTQDEMLDSVFQKHGGNMTGFASVRIPYSGNV